MPELPEVETVRRGLRLHVENKTIHAIVVRRANLRYPLDAEQLQARLTGQTVQSLTRRAKYLLFEFQDGTLLIHLGMTGILRILPLETLPQKHDHVDFIFNDKVMRYNDTRRFGMILWAGQSADHRLLKNLGTEPLTEDFNPSQLAAKLQFSRRPIKLVLMDQEVVVGVGNIYANEALYAAGIHPEKPANTLISSEINALVIAVKTVLIKAIEKGGTSLKDFLSVEGKPGYFRDELKVYGRQGKLCDICHRPIQKSMLGQRATYFCTQCQKNLLK